MTERSVYSPETTVRVYFVKCKDTLSWQHTTEPNSEGWRYFSWGTCLRAKALFPPTSPFQLLRLKREKQNHRKKLLCLSCFHWAVQSLCFSGVDITPPPQKKLKREIISKMGLSWEFFHVNGKELYKNRACSYQSPEVYLLLPTTPQTQLWFSGARERRGRLFGLGEEEAISSKNNPLFFKPWKINHVPGPLLGAQELY